MNNKRVRSNTASWICCQLGAREQYAVPRALHAIGALNRLLTDVWVSSGNLVEMLRRSLRERFHPDLATARVRAWNMELIGFELAARAKRLSGWHLILARNRWFQGKIVDLLTTDDGLQTSDQPILFSYSYAALEPLQFAKAHGWRTVLGQIDPGPHHEEIVAEEVAREPQFATIWEPAPAKYWTQWREECELADCIIVNSQWSRQSLLQAGIPEEKLRIVPVAFEPVKDGEAPVKIYPKQFTNKRPLRVLFLGQINLGKGIARLLKAATILRDEPLEFWIVGPLQIPKEAPTAADARIRWIGPVGRGRAGEYYRRADVFILPTLSDGFGLTQLEALARKLPLIVSRNCGTVVRDGVDGILLPEPTSEAIVDALLRCLHYPDQLAAFSHNAMVRDEFTLESLGGSLLRLQKELTDY
jgi:glycosyltransferase involved in cell wall biosynthesis